MGSAGGGVCCWERPAADPSRLAGPFVLDWELALGGVVGAPCALGAFLFGVPAPSTAVVAQGSPVCKVVVGSGRLGKLVVGHLPQGGMQRGLSHRVCVCVCVRIWAVYVCGCLPGVGSLLQLQARASALLQQALLFWTWVSVGSACGPRDCQVRRQDRPLSHSPREEVRGGFRAW